MFHRLMSPQTVVWNPHITWFISSGWVSKTPHHHCLLIQTQHSRNCELGYASWCNCRFAESLARAVTCQPFLIPVLDRGITEMHGPVSPSLWTPCASSSCCSTSGLSHHHMRWCHLHLCVCSGQDPCTHRHVTQAHTCKGQGHECKRNTWQYMKNTFLIQNIEISIFLIGKSPFWSSNMNYTKVQLLWRSISA